MVTPGAALSTRTRCCLELEMTSSTMIMREDVVDTEPTSCLGASTLDHTCISNIKGVFRLLLLMN